MKLISIETKNFKSLENKEWALRKVNLELGENGKGKTSLQQAIYYSLTGNLPEHPVSSGKDSLTVSAVLDNGQNTCISRTYSLPNIFKVEGIEMKKSDFLSRVAAVKRTGKHCLVKELNEISYQYNGACDPSDEDVFSFFENGKMIHLRKISQLCADIGGTEFYMKKGSPSAIRVDGGRTTSDAVKQYISNQIGGKAEGLEMATSENLMEMMMSPELGKNIVNILPLKLTFDKLCELACLSEEEKKVLSPYFSNGKKITIDGIQKTYRDLYSTRASIRKEKDLYEKQYKIGGFSLPLPDPAAEQAKHAEMLKQLGKASTIVREWQEYDDLLKKKQQMEASLSEIEKKISDIPEIDTAKIKEEVLTARQKEDDIRKEIEADNKAIASLNAANAPILKILKDLETTICPLCSSLVCTTDKTACKKDLEESVLKNSEASKIVQQRVSERKNDLQKLVVRDQDLQQKLIIAEMREGLVKQAAAIKAGIPDVSKKPEPVMDMKALQVEATKCENHIRQISLYKTAEDAYEKFNGARSDYDLYDSLVKKSEPQKGLLVKTLLNFITGPIEQNANAFLETLYPDMKMRFVMTDAGLSIQCKPHGRANYYPAGNLSSGERMLVCFAIMDVVSSYSNTRLMVFDNLEMMDKKTLSKLFELIMRKDVQDRYDHIILSSVDHDSIEKLTEQYGPEINVIRV